MIQGHNCGKGDLQYDIKPLDGVWPNEHYIYDGKRCLDTLNAKRMSKNVQDVVHEIYVKRRGLSWHLAS